MRLFLARVEGPTGPVPRAGFWQCVAAVSLAAFAQPVFAQDADRSLEVCSNGEPTTPAGLPDRDEDGIADAVDNCLDVFNTQQRDTDDDNIGNACDPDLDNNGIVNTTDLGLLKLVFFQSNPDLDADFDGDGVVALEDLAIMRATFYEEPGPTGPCNAQPESCAGPVDFEFDDVGEVAQGNLFVFRTSDPATVYHARRLVSGESLCNPSVSANTFRGSEPWNDEWGFNMSGPILFHGSSIEPLESCDQTAAFIESNLNVWCGDDGETNCQFWCPWRSKLTREVL